MYRSARPLLGLGRTAAMRPQTLTRVALPTTAKRIAGPATAVRGYAMKPSSADLRTSARLNKANFLANSKAPSLMDQAAHLKQLLLPGTFVPLPFADIPKSPRAIFDYLYARLFQHGKDLAGIIGIKISSMPNWTTRPVAQLGRSQIVPTAKALHNRLAEAMAVGDKDTLREICTPRLYETLSAAVSRRKASEELTWELVRYNGTPRIISHKVAQLPPVGKSPALHQVVVAISSTQKLGKVNKETGKPIEGSSRVQKSTEYIVLSRQLELGTWMPTKWLVWGNLVPTTMETWKMEEKSIENMERQQLKAKGK